MAVAAARPYTTIRKDPPGLRVEPNMRDYDAERARFSWDAARAELDGLPGGGLNIAHEAVDRHAAGAARDRVALRWLGRRTGIEVPERDYPELSTLSRAIAYLGAAQRA